ncbi:MAG: signal recognition particle protein, partial [Kordiimonadaceae bacterium]|nr:signal recognition particle protein [Kordiimonadaceae bacterium]
MFDSLSDKLGGIFDKLKKRGALSESHVDEAMREVRLALLEADVALPVVKDFISKVKASAVGQEVVKSVTPGQMVVKIVNDQLVDMLGGDAKTIDLSAPAPVPMLMVGLQGSGKTTSTAKIAKRLKVKERKKVLMASLDVQRPAAMEQLKILGEQIEVATLPIITGQMPVDIAKRAITAAKLQGFDVVMLDTAGRLHVDQALMAEVVAVRNAVNPHETLLVVDALTGQDAVNVAEQFGEQVGVTGVVLTRMDGDGRGGAALSMRAVTGKPIKLVGVGEKIDDLEEFHPERVASRILGMGDVVSLVEKAAETIEAEDAERMMKKMKKGMFDF